MSEFDRDRPPFRLADTFHGDDLQSIAYRELGDANRWPEIVWLNNLVPPFITDNELLAGTGVALTGSAIRVPAPFGVSADEDEDSEVFASDCQLVGKRLVIDEFGDLAVVSGSKNLVQQLTHRVNTPRGQMRRHPEYGNLAWRLLGVVNGPTAGALGSQHVKACLLADYRVSSVPQSVATITGDSISVVAQAKAVSGKAVDVVAGSQSS